MSEAVIRRLNRKAACDYLLQKHGVSRAPQTLARLATVGGGPLYVKFGQRPLYAPADLDAWVVEKMSAPRRSTSSSG